MTRSQFIAQWTGASEAERFAAFVSWMQASIYGYGTWVSTEFRLTDTPAGHDCGGFCDIGTDLFGDDSLDDALNEGQAIIVSCSNYARNKERKAWEEAEKDRQKQIDKWLDKMAKEQAKAMSEAAKAYAKYLKEKYDLEKGS